MRKSVSARSCPNSQETVCGFCYLAFQLLLLPTLLTMLNAQLSAPLREAELNFVFYLINFIAVLLIFHDFLAIDCRESESRISHFLFPLPLQRMSMCSC